MNDRPWRKVKSREDLIQNLKYPQLEPETFSQLYEVTASIHSLRKGEQVASHLRFLEVLGQEPEDFSEFAEMMCSGVKCPDIRDLPRPPRGYQALHNQGILPPWPGPGTVYKLNVPPSYKSNKDQSAWILRYLIFYILQTS